MGVQDATSGHRQPPPDPVTTGLATLVCATDARLLWASTGVEQHFRAGTLGIQASTGVLHLDDPEAEAALHAALRGAHAGDRRPSEFRIPGPGPEEAIRCIVIPLQAPGEPVHPDARTAAVLLQRSRTPVGVDPQRLVGGLGLSRAEAEVVAGLMQGEDLPAIATRRGVTLQTIRSALKSARRKLGCHSQSELVTRGWLSIAVIPDLATGPPGS